MGVPYNFLLEVVVGMDGIESVLENVFGADGVLRRLESSLLEQFQIFRDFSNKTLRKHYAVNKQSPRPSGVDISFKIMGQEIRVMSYDDIVWMIDQIDNMNVNKLFLKMAIGGHKPFRKSGMFLEMTHTVPTGLGLPLKLKLVGSTVATVEFDGQFDIEKMVLGTGAAIAVGSVKPSAVVELSGQMGIHSHYVSTGVFVNSSMLVSDMLKGTVTYKKGEGIKINLDTIEDPIQLFNFS